MNQSIGTLVPAMAGIVVVVLLGMFSSKLIDKTSAVRRVWSRRLMAVGAFVAPHILVYVASSFILTGFKEDLGWFLVLLGQALYALWLVWNRPHRPIRVNGGNSAPAP